MKIIKISKGKETIVDDDMFKFLNQWTWHCNPYGYAVRTQYEIGSGSKNKRTKAIFMHRLIMNTPNDKVIDHINHNPLDNRRSNLRICSRTENQRNMKLISISNKSGYKGVSWSKPTKSWVAQIQINKKQTNLGRYLDIKEAARAYNKAAIKYFGEFANINIL